MEWFEHLVTENKTKTLIILLWEVEEIQKYSQASGDTCQTQFLFDLIENMHPGRSITILGAF